MRERWALQFVVLDSRAQIPTLVDVGPSSERGCCWCELLADVDCGDYSRCLQGSGCAGSLLVVDARSLVWHRVLAGLEAQ